MEAEHIAEGQAQNSCKIRGLRKKGIAMKTERRQIDNNSSEMKDVDGKFLTNRAQETGMMIFDETKKLQTSLAYPPRTGIREVTQRLPNDRKKREMEFDSVDDQRNRVPGTGEVGDCRLWPMVVERGINGLARDADLCSDRHTCWKLLHVRECQLRFPYFRSSTQ